MNIFVAKLDYSTTSEQLEDMFGEYGEVASAKVIYDRETGKSRGFGFVEMDDDDQAWDAINALNGSMVDGREIVVKKAEDRSNNRGGGGGGYRGGGGGGYRGGGGGGYRGGWRRWPWWIRRRRRWWIPRWRWRRWIPRRWWRRSLLIPSIHNRLNKQRPDRLIGAFSLF